MPMERLFTDEAVEAAIDRGMTASAFAAEMGCSVTLAGNRFRRVRLDRGDAVAPAHDIRWDNKLRARPRRATVLALLKSHGTDAVEERWGGPPSSVLKRARA